MRGLLFAAAACFAFVVAFSVDNFPVTVILVYCGLFLVFEIVKPTFAVDEPPDGWNRLWQQYRNKMRARRERWEREQEEQEFRAELEKHYPIKNTNDCSVWDYRDSHKSTQLECLVPGCGWRKKVLPADDEEAEYSHRKQHYYKTRRHSREGRATWLMHSKFR